MALLLGVDVGTSSLKVVLFDEASSTPSARLARNTRTRYPEPSYAEQDAEDWFRAFLHCHPPCPGGLWGPAE